MIMRRDFLEIIGSGQPLPDVLHALCKFFEEAAADWERREAALKRSEAFLAQAQRLTGTGSVWWRTSTGEITWSEETYRLMEYPVSVVPTTEMAFDRCHPDDVALVRDTLSAAVRDRANVDFEHRLIMPDGRVKHVRVVFQKANNGSGQREYIGAVIDLTEWKRSQDTLVKLRSDLSHCARVTSLGTLSASIAHEVNQPLSGVVTNAGTCLRMLASEPPDIDGARESAQRAIRDGKRASDVVSRVRALFSRKPPAGELVDLNDATREVVTLSRAELHDAGVTMRLALADPLPVVSGDRVQLQQVISNLVRNAVDAMSAVYDRPREINITTARDGDDRVRLCVRDSGSGFGVQSADRVFDAFYSTKQGGMGIGLSVSRSIVESHCGRLWADANEATGATFSLSLPCMYRENILDVRKLA
jgi:C4-dicarboxylate-specific signal transduction histidine kinase